MPSRPEITNALRATDDDSDRLRATLISIGSLSEPPTSKLTAASGIKSQRSMHHVIIILRLAHEARRQLPALGVRSRRVRLLLAAREKLIGTTHN